MSHGISKRLKDKRKKIAAYLQINPDKVKASEHFDCSWSYIAHIAVEFGIVEQHRIINNKRLIELVADLIHTDKSYTDLGYDYDVVQSSINAIALMCIDANIPIQIRRMGRPRKDK